MQPGHCINADNVLIIPGAINCFLDFLILVLVRMQIVFKGSH